MVWSLHIRKYVFISIWHIVHTAFGEDLIIQRAMQDLILSYQIIYCKEYFVNSERQIPDKNYNERFSRPSIFLFTMVC